MVWSWLGLVDTKWVSCGFKSDGSSFEVELQKHWVLPEVCEDVEIELGD
jgi:hypothetical protein